MAVSPPITPPAIAAVFGEEEGEPLGLLGDEDKVAPEAALLSEAEDGVVTTKISVSNPKSPN